RSGRRCRVSAFPDFLSLAHERTGFGAAVIPVKCGQSIGGPWRDDDAWAAPSDGYIVSLVSLGGGGELCFGETLEEALGAGAMKLAGDDWEWLDGEGRRA